MIENASFQDKEVQCRDCKGPFTLTGGEQQFFAEKGLHTPTRCKPCRIANRARKDAEMGGGGAVPPPGGGGGGAGFSRPVVFEPPPPQTTGRKQPKERGGGGKGKGRSDWEGGGGW